MSGCSASSAPAASCANLNLANVSVTANPGVAFQTVGTLAGIESTGTVSGVIAHRRLVDGGIAVARDVR